MSPNRTTIMEISTVEVPGSRTFIGGTAITFVIVALAGIAAALLKKYDVLILLLGWGIGLVAGGVGGGYTSWAAGVETGGDGATVGTLTGGLGNALGAIVGITALFVVFAMGETNGHYLLSTPARDTSLTTAGQLQAIVSAGTLGFLTGTLVALIGGAIGGYAGTRL